MERNDAGGLGGRDGATAMNPEVKAGHRRAEVELEQLRAEAESEGRRSQTES